MSQLFQSKALLAKLLATENLIIEQRQVETASFDLKSRTLTIPILKETLSPQEYDLFIGHEVGHALYTPSKDWVDSIRAKKIPKTVVNVVEDARIERKVKSKYPGLRNSFFRSYQTLFDNGFFGVDASEIKELNFIDRANLYFKVGPGLGIDFKNQQEEDFMDEIESAETFEQVVDISQRIADYMREEVQDFKLPPNMTLEISFSDEESGNDSDESMSISADQLLEELENLLTEPQEGETEETDGSGDAEATEETAKEPETNVQTKSGGDDEADTTKSGASESTVSDLPEEKRKEATEELIESKTDEAYHENEKHMFDLKNLPPVYVNIPVINSDDVVIPYKRVIQRMKKMNLHDEKAMKSLDDHYFEYRKSMSKVVSYLVKEFELRKNADVQKRARIAKTGEIDTNRLHAYKFSDDIFKRLTNLPEGKSHGLVLFLDWSGSMKGTMSSTIRQLISLVMFCKKVNIPFEVYSFSEKFIDDTHVQSNHQTFKHRDLAIGNLNLVNIFSSRMSASEFKYMATYLSNPLVTHYTKHVMHLSGTPLNEAAICALDLIPKFKKANRLQIVNTVFLTDGDSNTLTNFHNMKSGPFGDVVSSSFSNRSVVLTDTVTRYDVKVKPHQDWRCNSASFTRAIMSILKHRTGCNILGFFLVDQRNFANALPYFKDYNQLLRMKDDFTKNKFVIAESVGYDEFYIIKDEEQKIVDFEDVVVTSSATRSILAAFKKHSTNKIQSRTVLNRFIHMIA